MPPWVAYAAAFGGTLVAAAVRYALGEANVLGEFPYLLFALPVLVAAWLGGWGPGLAATGAGMIAVAWLQIPRDRWLSAATLLGMLMFVVQGVVITYLGSARLRAVGYLSRATREADERVRQRTHELWLAKERLEGEAIERERASAELRLMADKLEASNRELQDFASVASHDLQEPLRKIQAFGDRLAARYSQTLGPEGLDYLQRMQKASVRMQTLINDLLVLSRIASKAQPFTELDLKDIAGEVVSDLESRIVDSGARVCIGDLPRVEADPTQMRQLLQNLLGNALKFRRAGVPPYIMLDATVDEAAGSGANGGGNGTAAGAANGLLARITVTDNGIGFDEKYAEKIFTIFQRLHGRGEFEGTGIGLAVCRRIVERHRGTITARSRPGEGSTFEVTLPVHQPDGLMLIQNVGQDEAQTTDDGAQGSAPERSQGEMNAATA